MIYDTRKVHRLFGIAGERSRGFRRLISVFRTKDGINITLNVYPKPKEGLPYICITVGAELLNQESYYLYSDGSVSLNANAHIKRRVGTGFRLFKCEEKCTSQQILEGRCLGEELNTLAEWLQDQHAVRVDPYDYDRIIDEGDDEIDNVLAGNIAMVDDFEEKLKKLPSPLPPGIYHIE